LADRALPEDEAALGRMGLAPPHGMGGRLLRRLVRLGSPRRFDEETLA
jgi:hypothetical protein